MNTESPSFTSDNPSLSLPNEAPEASIAGASLAINCKSASESFLQSIAISLIPPQAPYLLASVSEATKRAYTSDLAAFLKAGYTVPSTPEQVASYLAELADVLSPVTLQRRVVSVGKAHKAAGYGDPAKSEHVRATLRGIRRLHGRPQRQATPLLREELLLIVDGLPDSLMGTRDRALLLVGFAGGFRRSELVSLDVADVVFVPEGMLITLRRSKTDQDGNGRKIGIPFGRSRACPVKALRAWLDKAALLAGPLFRAVGKGGKIGGRALSDQSINLVLRKCAMRVGLTSDLLSGHSLRAGLVTSAAKAGVSSWKIRQQTGHRSDAMLQRYIRDADIFVDNAAGAIL